MVDSHGDKPLTSYPGKFNGKIIIHPERLSIFAKTRKPTVFAIWNDLFHEDVDSEFTFYAFDAMRINQRHIFLVLTKRPQNINKDYFEIMERHISNVWLGLTIVNQAEADEKIPAFLQVPGKKYLSIEPMLDEINIRKYIQYDCDCGVCNFCNTGESPTMIDAVLLGGETGPGARPVRPEWVRSVRDQCYAAGVPFFFKGWGRWKGAAYFEKGKMIPGSKMEGRLLDGRTHDELPWAE
jgi:protein gp37